MLREPSREVKDEILMVFFLCMKMPSRLKFMFIWMQAVNHIFSQLCNELPKSLFTISLECSQSFFFIFTVEVQDKKG